jgi:hypothetical protein
MSALDNVQHLLFGYVAPAPVSRQYLRGSAPWASSLSMRALRRVRQAQASLSTDRSMDGKAAAHDSSEGGVGEKRRLQHLAWDYKAKADPYGDDDYVRRPRAPIRAPCWGIGAAMHTSGGC